MTQVADRSEVSRTIAAVQSTVKNGIVTASDAASSGFDSAGKLIGDGVTRVVPYAEKIAAATTVGLEASRVFAGKVSHEAKTRRKTIGDFFKSKRGKGENS